MTLEQLEAELLALPEEAQAELLARLLKHLGQANEIDSDVSVWVEEAELRDRELETGQAIGIPAADVFQSIRASLQ